MCPGRYYRLGIETGSPDPKARIIPLDQKSGLEVLGWILTLIGLHYFHFWWLHPRFLSGYYTPDSCPFMGKCLVQRRVLLSLYERYFGSNDDCHIDPRNVHCDPDAWHGFVWMHPNIFD